MHRLSTSIQVLAWPKWAVYRGEYLRGAACRAFSPSQLKLTAPSGKGAHINVSPAPQKHVQFRQRRDAVQGSGAPTRKSRSASVRPREAVAKE